jgi:hypothetical protein
MSKNTVKSSFRDGKLLCFKVDGTGTAKITGPDRNLASLTDNGTGDYTLTLASAAKDSLFVTGIFPVTEDVVITQQTDPTTSAIRFTCRSLPVAEKTATLTLNGIKFHSLLQGADGNDITIAITGGATAGSEVITSTSAGAITIQVETTVSTATQVYAALKAATDAAVSAFVGFELITGATTWATAAAAPLTGGVTGVATAAVDCDFDVVVLADTGVE